MTPIEYIILAGLALLSAGGMSIDVVSAAAMRHATKGVGKIALAALKGEGE